MTAALVSALIALAAFAPMAPATASGSAQADQATTAASAETRCSGWKAVHGFVYRECLVWQYASGGASFHTGMQVRNATLSNRAVYIVQRTIINGHVVGTTYCNWVLAPNVTMTCWEPSSGMRFLPDGSYAYGNGTIIDKVSGQSGGTSSPLLDLSIL
jgi:hypothetical protein